MPNSITSTNNVSYEIYKNNFKATKPNFGATEPTQNKQDESNKKLLYAAGGIILGASTAGLIAICSGGKNKKAVSQLQEQVTSLQKNIGDLTSQISTTKAQKEASDKALAEQKALTEKLQKQINGIFEENPNLTNKYFDEWLAKYRKVTEDASLSYDPMKPLKNGEQLKKAYGAIDYRPAKIMDRTGVILEGTDTQTLVSRLSTLRNGESLEVPFIPNSDKVKIKKAPNAPLQADNMPRVGKLEDCDKALNAGITAKWDEEKISRDLLQNFYDGHGHTLDGVKMVVTKTDSGKFKVRIEGKSTYNCEYVSADGLSTKSANLDDAGGFGEGLKMVNVSMLAKKLTGKISYGSADWKYDITAGQKYMQRQLNKVDNFDGNFVEFETSNEGFVQKLLHATNYFEHSKNPDFKGLMYEDADMGISFLGKDKKGNFYLTQRFAYGDEKGWEAQLDGLNIFFRRKPDANFTKGRDRSFISDKDLEGILKSFTENIPREKALDMIMDMQSVWAKESSSEQPKAYKILLEALCDRVGYYKNVDLTNQKFVAVSKHENSRTIERLKEYGYTICDDCLGKIGMPKTDDVLAMYSAHNPLQPTASEIKKMKLLGEAVQIVAEQYSKLDDTKALIKPHNPKSPVFVFDRHAEKCENTLAEAMIDHSKGEYLGHWVSRDHLKEGSFSELLSTWLHETLHQYAGDGDPAFGYKLTDLLGDTFKLTSEQRMKLNAIKKAFEEIKD